MCMLVTPFWVCFCEAYQYQRVATGTTLAFIQSSVLKIVEFSMLE